jgi:NAD(P)-dependent dehydrogenase (short-subunit alcohol dehydrogenase family)
MATYSASKAGVVGLTQALQDELGPDGIKATSVCPAFVDTPMVDWIADRVGADRLISVDDVVAMVLALLRLSPGCNVPQIVLEPPAGKLIGWDA